MKTKSFIISKTDKITSDAWRQCLIGISVAGQSVLLIRIAEYGGHVIQPIGDIKKGDLAKVSILFHAWVVPDAPLEQENKIFSKLESLHDGYKKIAEMSDMEVFCEAMKIATTL